MIYRKLCCRMFVEQVTSHTLLWGYRPSSHTSHLVSISENKHSVHSCLKASETISQYHTGNIACFQICKIEEQVLFGVVR